ncbi:hypothetical protein ACHAWO_002717 [Cyclotella atomus]|jgi:hypothetical protein|uniref:Schwannomin interacting protein 1 C-terminal domain-containing protein n=1 Tax=Cyclotella atomus TaxID=382360 RepID=A0ABD3PN22_9STRA
MVITTIMALESLTEYDDGASDASSCDDDMQIVEMPMKDDGVATAAAAKQNRRSSWKFNTDWESAISSFRSATSSMLSNSFNSWYNVLDIDDSHHEDELDVKEDANGCNAHRASKSKSFKRSLHSTLEERTSFQSSIENDHEDMNEYLEYLNRSKALHAKGLSHLGAQESDTPVSNDADVADTVMLRRLSELMNMKCDMPDLRLMQIAQLDKDEAKVVQERVNSLQDLNDELNGTKKCKARTA